MRLEYPNLAGSLRRILAVISEQAGDVGTIDILYKDRKRIVREVSFAARDLDHAHRIIAGVRVLPEMKVIEARDLALQVHQGGKITMSGKLPLETQSDLSLAYTPAVGRVSQLIGRDPEAAWALTIKRNTVAVVSDGTAILGLGDLGPAAAMPVMEGKALLFKHFAGVDAWPICLDTKDPDKIVDTVRYLAPSFGGINLEDISAPRCFDIEERLKAALDIPVFHDDQHGTSVVVLAALINALQVVGKHIDDIKVVVLGIGSGGTAVSYMLLNAGVRNLIGVDREGIIYRGRTEGMNPYRRRFAERTNPDGVEGDLRTALRGADVFIGMSGPNLVTPADLAVMNEDPIVFALANPDPEIIPELAAPHVRVMATGRSDYPNQINNVLGFPGIFRGALDVYARTINEEMKLAAAYAIAGQVSPSQLSEEYIIPSVFHPNLAYSVAKDVAEAARASGVSRNIRGDYARLVP
jgi:malate dehydrogenase (oxaloacetate-decarboxylating)